MPTTVTVIVDPDNGAGTDYTSLSAAEAAEQRNLVTADEIAVFECRSTSGTADTNCPATFAGWTTDSTRYVQIQSSGANKHSGAWSTSKYRLVLSQTGFGPTIALSASDADIRVVGLQVSAANGYGGIGYAILITNTGGQSARVYNCIIKTTDSHASGTRYACLCNNSSATPQTSYVYNNLIVLEASGAGSTIALQASSGGSIQTIYAENNTIIQTGGATTTKGLEQSVNGAIIARNNLVYNFGNTNTYVGTFSQGSNYNTTDSTDSMGIGSNNRISQTFTFTNSGAGDYSLASGDTGAKDRGSNLSEIASGFTDDIIGTARPGSAVDCGCFEYASASIGYGGIIQRQIPGKVEYPFVLNEASPQAEGLVLWYPGDGAGGKLWDRSGRGNNGTLTNFAAPFTAASGWVAGVDGGKGGLVYDGSDDYVAIPNNNAVTISGTTAFSYTMWMKLLASPSSFATLFSKGYDGSQVPYFIDFRQDVIGTPGGTPYMVAAGYSGSVNSGVTWGAISTIDFSQSANIGVWWHVAAVYDTGTVYLYLNGKLHASGTRYSVVDSSYGCTVGGLEIFGSVSRNLNATIENVRFYRRALSAGDCAAMYDPRTRWDLRYVPRRIVFFTPPAGTGNQTVTPTTATLTLTTFAPTVLTPSLCTPTTLALTLTTFAPTVRVGANVTPTTASLTLTTFAPTVSTPRLCTPTTLALTLTTFAPTVSTPRLCTPTTLALTLTAFAPTIVNPKSATPTTLALTLTTFAPTVTGGQGLTVTPTTAALTLVTFAPTVVNPKSATPTTLALTLSTFAPTVSTPRTVTPTTLSLSLTTFAPTVVLPKLVTPSKLALILTTFAPSISTGDITVVPSTLALSLAGYAPTVSTAAVVIDPFAIYTYGYTWVDVRSSGHTWQEARTS